MAKGSFWIGTMQGVTQFDGRSFSSFPIPKAHVEDTTTTLSYDRVTSILEDRDGTLWFGTDGFGITRYDGSSFSHLTMQDGLCDNNVTDLIQDEEGDVWIATMFGGICRYDGQHFTNYTLNGIVDGVEVWSIYEDSNGDLWFPAEHVGVYRYDGERFTKFDATNGLLSLGIQSFHRDRAGRFWLGGWGGLFRFEADSFYSVTRDGPWE